MSNWVSWPTEFTLSQTDDFSNDFPLLHPDRCVGTPSPYDESYNCIAWAARETDVRWDPDQWNQFYWPDNVPRIPTVEACKQAYQTIGFEECDNSSLEPGVEKIAIYGYKGDLTHAARQLENGNWTTKFGDFEDVEHVDLDCLEGPLYGEVAAYMRRPRT